MRVRSFFIIIAFLYLLFTALSVIYGFVGYRLMAACLGCIIFLYMVFGANAIPANNLSRWWVGGILIAIIALLFCFSLLSSQSSGGRSLFAVMVFIGSLGVCWFSIASCSTAYLYEFPFYLLLGVTLFLFLGLGYGPSEFNTVLTGYSRNGYSAILLAFASGYIFSRVYREKKISLFLMLLVLVSSFPLYGRSGIAMAFALFIVVLFHRSAKIALLIGVMGLVGVIFGLDSIEKFVLGATNFSSGIESPRSEMLAQYIERVDAWGLFFGVDLGSVPVIVEYKGNPHNAFILLHSYYGIASVSLLCLFVISCWMLFVEKQYTLLVVALIFLVRAFFDIIYLFGLFDYLIFPLLFYAAFVKCFRRPYCSVPFSSEAKS